MKNARSSRIESANPQVTLWTLLASLLRFVALFFKGVGGSRTSQPSELRRIPPHPTLPHYPRFTNALPPRNPRLGRQLLLLGVPTRRLTGKSCLCPELPALNAYPPGTQLLFFPRETNILPRSKRNPHRVSASVSERTSDIRGMVLLLGTKRHASFFDFPLSFIYALLLREPH